MVDVRALVSSDQGKAFGLRWKIPVELSEKYRPGQIRISCLTLLAGAGTRWIKSLAAAREGEVSAAAASGEGAVASANAVATSDGSVADAKVRHGPAALEPDALKPAAVQARDSVDFPLSAPRGLYPVKNYIGARGLVSNGAPPTRIPLAAYAVDAFRGLGHHTIVIRGWKEAICSQVLTPLGIDCSDVDFFEQRPDRNGKVSGHGDATWQARDLWNTSEYVMVNFGGDANSPLTALASALAMAALVDAGEDIGLLLPVARIRNPAYPVHVDRDGRPTGFGHDKLGGKRAASPYAPKDGYAYTNVGIRVYRTADLADALQSVRERYWNEPDGYTIPGNDPAGHEFALDNVDSLLASEGRARILPIAAPDELSPAKSFDEIPRFEASVAQVRAEWNQFLSATSTMKSLTAWTERRGR